MTRSSMSDLPSGPLSGTQVLVVEDDYLVAQEVAATLRDNGASVLGPVPDAARGLSLADKNHIDCALLDINLKGRFVFDLARHLAGKGVHLLFTTGYDTSFLPADLRHAGCLQKPVDMHTLVQAVLTQSPAGPVRPDRRNPTQANG